ncbi:MAG: hypothetical protein WC515_04430 [Candidatus Omnitrophota bacterium]
MQISFPTRKNLLDPKIMALSFAVAAASFCAPLFGEYAESLKGTGDAAASAVAEGAPPAAAQEEWRSTESEFFTIYYRPDASLKSMDRKLRRRGYYMSWGRSSEVLPGSGASIARRMDSIFGRVEEVLDMYPRNMHIKIRIFRDREELSEEYNRIFHKSAHFKSFYVHKHETIYTSEEDISDSVISHEMGHAIVDHYFAIIPPPKIRELLASYVDTHLDEE